ERIMLIGAVADYADDTLYVKEILSRWDKRSIYFEAGVLVNGLESFRKNDERKEEILRFLASGKPPSHHQGLIGAAFMNSFYEEEMRIRIKNSFKRIGKVSYVIDPKGPLGKAATYARSISGAIVGIAVSIEEKKADISIRTESNLIDLNLIVRNVASKYDGSGGGHRKAAGAKIPKDRLEEFLECFSKEVEEALKHLHISNG
ncbi:MAG: DHH family phosphoesterase, partial [Candidatus Methanomethylicia archaeon]